MTLSIILPNFDQHTINSIKTRVYLNVEIKILTNTGKILPFFNANVKS